MLPQQLPVNYRVTFEESSFEHSTESKLSKLNKRRVRVVYAPPLDCEHGFEQDLVTSWTVTTHMQVLIHQMVAR
jgi:hypothetical protein